MPIIANNIIVVGIKEKQEPIAAPVIETPIVEASPPTMTAKARQVRLSQIKRNQEASEDEDPVLIVNGQEKRVRKHSTYLLDMLTIDDDK
jgi:hypothetical protein